MITSTALSLHLGFAYMEVLKKLKMRKNKPKSKHDNLTGIYNGK